MRYMRMYIPEPHMGLSKNKFEERAYSSWAINEIITRMFDSPQESFLTTIEQFILELDFCIYFAGDNSRKRIFTIAKTVTEEVLDYLLKS